MEVDTNGTLRFSFQATRRRTAIDDTIEDLLALPGQLAAERKRRVAVIFDEFQEVLALDPKYPNLMRAVFQTQPEVGHVYLGSKRHLLDRIFDDENEPFWRSAKRIEIGLIDPAKFASSASGSRRRIEASATRPCRGSSRPRSATPTARRSWRTSSGSSFQKVALRIAWTWRMPSGKLSAPSTATSARSGMTHRPRNDS